jgi:redox-sensitive bicupin YhaK (pirin superfamily)
LPVVHQKNQLLPVASGQGLPEVVTLHTDATIYLSEFEAQHTVTFPTDGSRRVFLYVTDGDLEVLGQTLHAKDQARIDPEVALILTARSDVRFVLIDVPSCRGWGYDQDTLRGVRR